MLFGDGSYSTWTDWQGESSGCDDGIPGYLCNEQSWGNSRILRFEMQLCLRDGGS